MFINSLLKQQNMSIYRLAKESGLPYATVNDICNQKAALEKCSAETVYRLANALNVSMEDLLAPQLTERSSFELFKSSVCHRLKDMGDVPFLIDLIESNYIRIYYDWEWYPESLYLLAMLDYISKENDVPLCTDYDDLRSTKLAEPLFPAGILAQEAAGKPISKTEVLMQAIPEFLKYNIIESDVRSVA